MYTFWKRSAPPASMEIFNAPTRETCTVRRERTDTPLQALVTLNDPQFVEAARMLGARGAERRRRNGRGEDRFLGLRLVSRPFTADGIERDPDLAEGTCRHITGSSPKMRKQLLTVGDMPADANLPPTRLAAWTMLTNELMNLDEVLNK